MNADHIHNIQRSHHPETDSFNNSSVPTENAKKTHQLQVVQKTHHTSLCRAVLCLARLNDVSTVALRVRSVLMSTRVWMGMSKEPLKFNPLNSRASPNSSRHAMCPGVSCSARENHMIKLRLARRCVYT